MSYTGMTRNLILMIQRFKVHIRFCFQLIVLYETIILDKCGNFDKLIKLYRSCKSEALPNLS